MDTIAKIQNRLKERGKQAARLEETIAKIMDLLLEADRKRQSASGDKRRWDKVLDRLETSLDDARARLNQLRQQEQRERRNLVRLREGIEEQAAPSEPEKAEPAADEPVSAERFPDGPVLTPGIRAAVRRILRTPMEDLHFLPLQVLTLGEQFLDGMDDSESGFGCCLAGRIELANQLHQSHHDRLAEWATHPAKERRRQYLLRRGLQNVRGGQIHRMDLEQVTLVLDCFSLLSRRIMLTPNTKRIMRLIGNSPEETSETVAQLKRRGAALSANPD